MTREEAIKWFEGEKEAAERQVVAFESCFKCFKSAHRKIVAYNDMAIAALREQPRWISVDERLPEPDTDVLARRSTGTNVECYHKEAGGYWSWDEYSGKWRVIHWMPLPEPPKEEV